MDIAIIAGLLVAGVILFLIEIFLIPGISVAGAGGVIATISAIVYAYVRIGIWAGHFTLVTAVLLIAVSLFVMLRTNSIDRFSLKSEIDSKVETMQGMNVSPGDWGTTVSRLTPIGKVEVNGNILEVKSEDGLIEEEQAVEVVKVQSNNIIVKLKTN